MVPYEEVMHFQALEKTRLCKEKEAFWIPHSVLVQYPLLSQKDVF